MYPFLALEIAHLEERIGGLVTAQVLTLALVVSLLFCVALTLAVTASVPFFAVVA